jgi:hypothetical protein
MGEPLKGARHVVSRLVQGDCANAERQAACPQQLHRVLAALQPRAARR